LVVVAFAAAACGGGGSATPAASSSAQSVTPAASAAGSASTGGQPAGATAQAAAANGGTVEDSIGHPVSICDLLPVATVASVTGEPLTLAKGDDTAGYKIYGCDYSSADGTSAVTVSVLALDAAAGFDSTMQADSNAKVINGLGDKAFSSILGVFALFGNVQITVSNLQSDDAAITLIKTLRPKL
jgi:hypothetical protein